LPAVGWGIVGLGGIATRMAQAVEAAEGAVLAAVCSRSLEKADEFTARFGARAYVEYAAMLADDAVDVVYVASPTYLHVEHTIAAARAGKHVLVEKPMALSVEDAEAMAAAAEQSGVRLGVGFHLRQHPVHVAMRDLIGQGGLGDVVLAQALWGFYSADLPHDSWKMDPARAGGGSVTALGVHMIDVLRWLVGHEVVEVSAVCDGPNDSIPVEFLTMAYLTFEGGTVATFVSSRRLKNTSDDLVLYCTQGRLRGIGTMTTEPVGALEIVRGDETELVEPSIRDLYTLEAEACSAALRDGTDLPATATDGVRSVEITAAVLESSRSGRAVRLPATLAAEME
jgi:1,5-anhydro-D-fructose reductase (1,5-anhydro-D-mannitol-forming)